MYLETECLLLEKSVFLFFYFKPPYIYFGILETLGGFFKLNFWILKITKLYLESKCSLWGDLFS